MVLVSPFEIAVALVMVVHTAFGARMTVDGFFSLSTTAAARLVAVDVGDQDVIGLRKPVVASLRRVDVHHLPARLNHEAGVLDGRDLERPLRSGELLRRGGECPGR